MESGTLLVFSLEFFQLLLFFVKNNVACLTVASQQPLSRGAGVLGGRGDSHRELTRRIVYKNYA